MSVTLQRVLSSLLIICTVILKLLAAHKIDYCNLKCQTREHTVCLRNYDCRLVNCREIEPTYYSRKEILDEHNQLRNEIASGNVPGFPSASNMNSLQYDLNLELVADCWVKAFNYSYDYCRSTQDYSRVGQNIYKGTTAFYKSYNYTSYIMTWYEQKQYLPVELIGNFSLLPSVRKYRHFTQLIHAESMSVGCGIAVDLSWENVLFACNYGVTGNTPGVSIYKKGIPASHCGYGRASTDQYPALCVHKTEPELPLQAYRRGVLRAQKYYVNRGVQKFLIDLLLLAVVSIILMI